MVIKEIVQLQGLNKYKNRHIRITLTESSKSWKKKGEDFKKEAKNIKDDKDQKGE
jgi:hypothetical protein